MKEASLTQEDKEKQLFDAIDKNDFSLFEYYIENFPDCFFWQYGNNSFASFHLAALEESEKFSPFSNSCIMRNFFFSAIKCGRFSVIKFFLEKYPKSVSWEGKSRGSNSFNIIPQEADNSIPKLFIYHSIKNKDFLAINYFMGEYYDCFHCSFEEYGDDFINMLKNEKDVKFLKSLFLNTILKKNHLGFEFFLQNHPDFVFNRYGENNVTALHVAISALNIEAAQVLINLGLSLEDLYGKHYETQPDSRFNSIFISVAGSRNINFPDNMENHGKMLEFLLKQDVLRGKKGEFIDWPLFYVSIQNSKPLMRFFSDCGFDLTSDENFQEAIEDFAIRSFVNVPITELKLSSQHFLRFGFSINAKYKGYTIAEHVIVSGFRTDEKLEILEFLGKKGANIKPEMIEMLKIADDYSKIADDLAVSDATMATKLEIKKIYDQQRKTQVERNL